MHLRSSVSKAVFGKSNRKMVWTSKDAIMNVKRQPTKWERISVNHLCAKDLVTLVITRI